jgi:hypothetical protein
MRGLGWQRWRGTADKHGSSSGSRAVAKMRKYDTRMETVTAIHFIVTCRRSALGGKVVACYFQSDITPES